MNTPSLENNFVYLRPYTSKELAAMYGVERRTLNKWLEPFFKDIGQKNGRYFSVIQVKIIFDRLGLPGVVVDD